MTLGPFLTASTVAISLLPGSLAAAGNPGLPDTHRLAAVPVLCRITPDLPGREVPRGLFGTNLEWFNNANGMADSNGAIDPAWASLAREQGLDHARFPGGTLADFYHWRDGIGPVSSRPQRDHPTDPGRSPNVMGTPEFLRFCASAGVRPLITVNAGTGTAAEAAAWVAYCNQPGHPERAADGLAAPATVSLWEIGNELYLPGNPGDSEIITITPGTYVTRFLEFAAAMRQVDPSIKLAALGTANGTVVRLPYPDWSDVVLAGAAAEMDYLAVHNAYYPMILGLSGLSPKDVYQSLWAAPEAVNRSLTQLDTLITRHESGRRIEIAITEWGALYSYDPAWIDHVKTMGSSVYLARLLQVFLGQPRVTLASYFKFADRTFMGWIGYDRKPKVPYHVVQLYARHFGRRLVPATIESPVFNAPALGVMPAETGVPELTVVASLNDDGSRLFINIVNRSWETVHRVKLDTGSFTPAPAMTAWRISAPGLTDHNGRDLPPEIEASFYQEPALHRDARPSIGIEQLTLDPALPVIVPPYSILTLELVSASGPL